MCLATNEPGGPRRCSGDTRAAYEKSATTARALHARHEQLQRALTARDATDRYRAATALPRAQRDELLAGFTAGDIDALVDARRQQIRPAVDAAFAATPALRLADTPRDTTIAEHAEIPIYRPHGTETMPATCLDAGTAVYRTRRGDYAIAYQDGEAYRTIATASKYKTALTKANQIPALTPIDQPPGGIDDLQQQAHRAHADTALQLATRAAHGQLTTPDEQAAFLAERLTHAREEIVDAAAATPLHNEILDATTRHRHHQHHTAAQAAGDAARRAAEQAGQDPEPSWSGWRPRLCHLRG